MARPRQHDADLRATLLDQAIAMIGEGGIESLSLRRLAQSSGTSTSAVYSLFGSKDDLLAALSGVAFDSFLEAQRAALGRGSAYEDLLALGQAYRSWAKTNPLLFQVMFSAPDLADPAVACVRAPLSDTVDALIAEGAFNANAIAAVTGLWSQVHGFVVLELAGVLPPGDLDSIFEQTLVAVGMGWTAVGDLMSDTAPTGQ